MANGVLEVGVALVMADAFVGCGNLVAVGAPEFVGATTVPLMAIEVYTTASTTVKTISAIKSVSSVIIRIS